MIGQMIERLVKATGEALNPRGYLLLEIGADQGKTVPSLIDAMSKLPHAEREGYYVTVLPDHAGLPRVVKAVRTA